MTPDQLKRIDEANDYAGLPDQDEFVDSELECSSCTMPLVPGDPYLNCENCNTTFCCQCMPGGDMFDISREMKPNWNFEIASEFGDTDCFDVRGKQLLSCPECVNAVLEALDVPSDYAELPDEDEFAGEAYHLSIWDNNRYEGVARDVQQIMAETGVDIGDPNFDDGQASWTITSNMQQIVNIHQMMDIVRKVVEKEGPSLVGWEFS